MADLTGVRPGDTIVFCDMWGKRELVKVEKVGRVWLYVKRYGALVKFRISGGLTGSGYASPYVTTIEAEREAERRSKAVSRLRDCGLIEWQAGGTPLTTDQLEAVIDVLAGGSDE